VDLTGAGREADPSPADSRPRTSLHWIRLAVNRGTWRAGRGGCDPGAAGVGSCANVSPGPPPRFWVTDVAGAAGTRTLHARGSDPHALLLRGVQGVRELDPAVKWRAAVEELGRPARTRRDP